MQTMTDKKFSISLTATIAELYETQKHYFAAYIAYWYLYQTESREEYRIKLNEIKERIFATYDLNYNPLIREIFTEEELIRFGILPENLYREFEKVVANLQKNEKDGLGGIETDDDEELNRVGKEISQEWRQMIEEEQAKARTSRMDAPKISLDFSRWENIKASYLIDFLTALKDKDEKLNDVSLSDLLERFLKHYEREHILEK